MTIFLFKLHSTKRLTLGIIGGLVGFALSSNLALAVGVTPAAIVVPQVEEGTQLSYTVQLFKDAGDQSTLVEYKVTPVGEYAKYVVAPDTISIAANSTSVEYEFELDTTGAAEGEYAVKLQFSKVPTEAASTAVGNEARVISEAGVIVGVDFTVVESVDPEVTFTKLKTYPTEVNTPLRTTVMVENIGVVDWRPKAIELLVDAVDNDEELVVFRNADVPLLAPGETMELEFIQDQHELSVGEYTMELAILNDESSQLVDAIVSSFTVHPMGTLSQQGVIIDASLNKTVIDVGETVKVDVQFENTGQVPVETNVEVELFNGNELIGHTEGVPQTVSPGEQAVLNAYVLVGEAGDLQFEVAVNYGDATTDLVLLPLTSQGPTGISTPVIFFWSVLGGIVVASGVLFLGTNRKTKKKSPSKKKAKKSTK